MPRRRTFTSTGMIVVAAIVLLDPLVMPAVAAGTM